jgi:hypothetical protein
VSGWRIVHFVFVLLVCVFTASAFADEVTENKGLASSGPLVLLAHNGHSITVVPGRAPAGSNWYVTESGYVAAVEEDLLDRAIFWAGMGNAEEFERFISSNPLVFPLRAGLRVQIDKFSFSDKVRIRPEGTSISVWTVREAIRSEVLVEGS